MTRGVDALSIVDLTAALDALSISAWSAGVLGTVVRFSDGWTRLTGQTRMSWEHEGWFAAVHPDDRERIVTAWQAFVADPGMRWEEQYRVCRIDTQAERVVADRVTRAGDPADPVFLRIAEDITGRITAEHEARRLSSKHDALQRVAEFVTTHHDTAAVSAFVARTVGPLFGADDGGVVRFGDDGASVVCGWWSATPDGMRASGAPLPRSEAQVVFEVQRTGEPARSAARPGAASPRGADQVAVPVRVGGRLWGALVLSSARFGVLTASASGRLGRFAELAAFAISEIEAQAAIRAGRTQQAAVNELSTLALAGGPLAPLFAAAVEHVAEALDVSLALVIESLAGGEAVIRAASGDGAASAGLQFTATGDTMTGAVLADGPSLIVDDFEVDGRFGRGVALSGMRGGACFVVRLADRVWGTVGVYTSERRVFTPEDLRFLESITNVIGSAVERVEAELTLSHQALHDALTGIPNRALLLDRLTSALERASRDQSLVGVLALDLDRFQDINDTQGHAAGDALLIAVANGLVALVRPGDTVARVGGDEFAVVAEHVGGPEEVLALAARLVRAVPDLGGGQLGASIGVVVRGGESLAADALRDANTALHRAKTDGLGGIELFDHEMRVRMLDRLRTEADLRGALERREFVLHYQPIVALTDGAVVALEGLIRWRHPTRGMLAPGAFISIAEDTGAILELGRYVITQACADAAHWNATRPEQQPITVNVNLSPLQLSDPTLPGFIGTSLAASGIAPGQLGIEITESVVFNDDPDHAARLLEINRRYGVRLLLDDFGTGYSSLSYIRRFPLDVLKLDQSFIASIDSDETAAAVVVAICQLAGALGMSVIAEGIERAEQIHPLRGIGCDYAQGYFFCRPVARTKVDRLLQFAPPWCVDDRRLVLGATAR